MDEKQIINKKITFPNGNKAQSAIVSPDAPVEDILSSLNIEKPKALILIFGGASGLAESLKPRFAQLFSRGIARTAIETGSIIIDGGTKAGVMELIGQAVSDQGRRTILLGVAPSGKVTYPDGLAEGSIENGAPLDPDHSHFVLVESKEWGGETEMMFKLAKALASKIPAITILANGGDISRKEVLLSVRQGWPIIVIEGTGGLANDIARILKNKNEKIGINESQMAEIIEEGDIRLFQLYGEVEEFKDLILKRLTINPTLKLAWERFALYDSNAVLQQKNTIRYQRSIIFLGVIATFFALSNTQLISLGMITPESMIYRGLRNIIIIIPILISILVAASKKFQEKNKWILLRISAESIKRAIFCYRTQTGMNRETNDKNISPEAKLAKEICSVSQQLMKTEVNLAGLKPIGQILPKMYGAAENDDGFSSLEPEDYITIRLEDQLRYYLLKSHRLEKQLKYWYWNIYIMGGLGTYLAAIGFELWVGFTTSLVGASISFLEFHKVEFSLTKYNKAATDLNNVEVMWTALSADQKRKPENINKLVIDTEKILKRELEGWIGDVQAESKAKQEEGFNKSNQTIGNDQQVAIWEKF